MTEAVLRDQARDDDRLALLAGQEPVAAARLAAVLDGPEIVEIDGEEVETMGETNIVDLAAWVAEANEKLS